MLLLVYFVMVTFVPGADKFALALAMPGGLLGHGLDGHVRAAAFPLWPRRNLQLAIRRREKMNSEKKHRVCPVERAGGAGLRCASGSMIRKRSCAVCQGRHDRPWTWAAVPVFSPVEMARLVGKTGRVIAADLQEGMLAMVRRKIQNTPEADRVLFHLCRPEATGLSEKCDFILVFYMLHEVPDQAVFLKEIKSLLKPEGRVLIVEPKWHVSRDDFLESIAIMKQAGFAVSAEPKIRFSRTIVVQHADAQESGSR